MTSPIFQIPTRNEATTRRHVIDHIFFECLSWEIPDSYLEEPLGNEYADYTFSSGGNKLLIVEAKKEGALFDIPAGSSRIVRPLRSILRDNSQLRIAVQQVAGYCQHRGVAHAAVTDGHQIVAFVGSRTDGIAPLDANALIFSSLTIALNHFQDLWQALSKPGIENKRLLTMTSGSVNPELPNKLSAAIHNYPGLKSRNPFQADLQMLSEFVLEDIARSQELEPVFLQDCYAQSGALSQYSLLSRNILQARYAALFPEESLIPQPPPVIMPAITGKGISNELVANSLSRRPILLLGDIGVGKSTFVRRLMKVDAVAQFADSITLSIDFGSQATLAVDLRAFVIDDIERQLREQYEIDIKENSFIRGVYYSDLQRFRSGLYGPLATIDPSEYQRLEIAELQIRISHGDQHLRLSLEHLQRARRKQIVLVLDNADQRNYETQQQVFLFAQETAEHWPVTVFVSLRPETFYRSTRAGALSGYHPKAFTISPPRTDILLSKRLDFAIRVTEGEIPLPRFQERTTIVSGSLSSLMQIMKETISKSRDIVEFIDNTSGGNMRVALDMVKGFFGSGHIDTEKMLTIRRNWGSYLIPLHEFIRAVMFGDNVHYDPSRSPIVNLFDISGIDVKEHFTLPLLLSSLRILSDLEAGEGYVPTTAIYDYLQGMGYLPEQIDQAIERGVLGRLLEQSPGRFTQYESSQVSSLRMTSAGSYHLLRLLHMFTYLDAMIVDTPILDRTVRSSINNVFAIEQRLTRASEFKVYLDSCWESLSSSGDTLDWPKISIDLGKEIESIQLRINHRKERQDL